METWAKNGIKFLRSNFTQMPSEITVGRSYRLSESGEYVPNDFEETIHYTFPNGHRGAGPVKSQCEKL
jgi:hypothetical protein